MDETPSCYRIRPVALCLFLNEGRFLVFEASIPATDTRDELWFHRPLGGGIEYGERAADAVRREMREELGVEITDIELLGTLENIWTFEGEVGHEIVFVFNARFVDESLYERDEFDVYEAGVDLHLRAVWLSIEDVRQGKTHPVYPDDLLNLLV
ncbi:MAG: NUDIX domain-containing protein [Candidatus Poribacteria bacterium]|nr:NUDIX domain-containing protein [Candidatus Poribacteria bacterium]